MGNKVCMLCVPIKIKRKVRSPTTSSATLASFPDLSLENFFEANAAPLPTEGVPFYTCKICCESKPLNDSFNVEGCTHFYCTKCTAKYIVSKLQDNILNLVCPESGCSGVLSPPYCKPILPNNVLDWWEKALSESVIPEKDKFYCPFNDCSALLLNEAQKEREAIAESDCPHCKRDICVQCKAPWHPELSCEKFQRMKNKSDDLMLDLAERRNWRRCPGCKHYIEKIDGCNEMKCRCSYRFCYECGVSSHPHRKQSCYH